MTDNFIPEDDMEPAEECLCYDCGRVFLVSDEDSELRFLKHDC